MITRRSKTLAALVSCLLTLGLGVAGSARAATTPPFEPDPNSVGSLSFYDAAGNVITSGHTNTAPFAAYVVGSKAIRAGDTKSFVYFANPAPMTTTNNFYVEQDGRSTANPVTGAPAVINNLSATRPVAVGRSNDQTLEGFESDSVASTTAGYQNVVQVRVRTSDAASQIGTSYESTDIMIDPTTHTWTQIYPAPAASTVPAAPTAVTASASTLSANVVWTAPADNGGSAITGYRVEYSTDGTTYSLGGTSSDTSATVGGLTAGKSYTFRVEAVNANGQSVPSAPSNAVVPTAATAPGAPTNVTAVAGNGSAKVSWFAPASNGGSAITGYQIEYATAGTTSFSPAPLTGAGTLATVTGLTNGSAYVFRVSAINAVGTGPASALSAAVTPAADTSALAIGAPASVRYGYTATITAKLTDSTTRAVLAKAPLTLYGRHGKTGKWSALKSVTTTSTGAASYGIKPTSYEQFYWHYAGTAAHKAISSAAKAVSVSQVVSAKATATKVKAKSLIKVYGTIAPAGSGQRVYLQVYSHGWKNVTSVLIKKQTLPNHKKVIGYVLGVKPAKGAKIYRVYKSATSTLLAGVSGQFSLAGK